MVVSIEPVTHAPQSVLQLEQLSLLAQILSPHVGVGAAVPTSTFAVAVTVVAVFTIVAVAVSVVVPLPLPVTMPAAVTVAIDASALVHAIVYTPVIGAPELVTGIALTWTVSPMLSEIVPAATESATSSPGSALPSTAPPMHAALSVTATNPIHRADRPTVADPRVSI
jgi:hypothetical protein